MHVTDDELVNFDAHGAAPLAKPKDEGFVENDGARIWYATYGSGPAVMLLHGGLGNAGNWGYQVPALVASGRQAVVMTAAGMAAARATTGRSTMLRWLTTRSPSWIIWTSQGPPSSAGATAPARR